MSAGRRPVRRWRAGGTRRRRRGWRVLPRRWLPVRLGWLAVGTLSGALPLLLTRPLSGPLALRPLGTLQLLEELLELFSTAGFDQHGALHAARLFTGFLYGHVLHELQEQIHNPDEIDDLLRLGLQRLPITQFPRLRSLATALATYDGAAELDEGLAIVLAGLRSQLRT